jgi:hypothetical protein
LGSLVLYRSAADSETVVGAARSLRRGHVLQPSDLTGVAIAGDIGDMFIAAGDARSLIGKVMLVDTSPGLPFVTNMVAEQAVLGADDVLTAVALEPGFFPPELAVGDWVSVALLPDPTIAQATPPEVFPGSVSVWSIVHSDGDFSSAIVTLRSDLEFSRAIAAAGSARLSLVGQPDPTVAP